MGICCYEKDKKEGIETDAVVSRIELHEWSNTGETWVQNDVMEEYYITYTDHDGRTVEAMLSNPGDHTFKVGDRRTRRNSKRCHM